MSRHCHPKDSDLLIILDRKIPPLNQSRTGSDDGGSGSGNDRGERSYPNGFDFHRRASSLRSLVLPISLSAALVLSAIGHHRHHYRQQMADCPRGNVVGWLQGPGPPKRRKQNSSYDVSVCLCVSSLPSTRFRQLVRTLNRWDDIHSGHFRHLVDLFGYRASYSRSSLRLEPFVGLAIASHRIIWLPKTPAGYARLACSWPSSSSWTFLTLSGLLQSYKVLDTSLTSLRNHLRRRRKNSFPHWRNRKIFEFISVPSSYSQPIVLLEH